MFPIRFEFGDNFIKIEDNGGGHLVLISNLKEDAYEDTAEYNAAIDGVESLLLSMAYAGILAESPEMLKAVESTVETIVNKLGD